MLLFPLAQPRTFRRLGPPATEVGPRLTVLPRRYGGAFKFFSRLGGSAFLYPLFPCPRPRSFCTGFPSDCCWSKILSDRNLTWFPPFNLVPFFSLCDNAAHVLLSGATSSKTRPPCLCGLHLSFFPAAFGQNTADDRLCCLLMYFAKLDHFRPALFVCHGGGRLPTPDRSLVFPPVSGFTSLNPQIRSTRRPARFCVSNSISPPLSAFCTPHGKRCFWVSPLRANCEFSRRGRPRYFRGRVLAKLEGFDLSSTRSF